MFKTTMLAAAALCTVGLFSTPAAFAKSVEVHYKDLDLGTVEGQGLLKKRIDKAARDVCRVDQATTGTHIRGNVDADCYRQARTNVSEQVAAAIDKADDTRLGG
ncbi:UrcA family protein [Novosphingobium guangzhouense]|uniref:UrcA family protein n=1 Tax=Novosphingobium guangzhouense TaxID=1850347 RepID=A0A2K2FSF2_9SPHN|nr:UrcA family protein [Novosphingobium guangzhouense]PNU01709.1 UrcA family protein [Novosphingobium guangzhouense]